MPDWKPSIRQRLAQLQLAPTREAAIVEELAQHLDDCYAESRSGGATEAEATRAALAELSESELLQRELRRVERQVAPEPIVFGTNRRTNMMADLWQDLRFGARMLAKQPAFTLIAVLSLTLGIGANTAVFSLIDAILWRPLAVSQPERLVAVYTNVGRDGGYRSLSYADYIIYRDQQQSFSGLAAYARVPVKLTHGDQIEQLGAELVTGNFFSVLGINAAQGRLFTPEDDRTRGAHPVAVISQRLWRERFNLDPAAIGRALNVNGQEYAIIGVAPAQFSSVVLDWGKQPDVWLPMMMQSQVLPANGGIDLLQNRDARWLLLVGRLKEGVELARAEAEMRTLSAQIATAWPQNNAGRQAILLPISQARFWPEYRQETARLLMTLQSLVALALLIACFNVANLLLARAAARRREIGTRLALGAGRWRLIRQWLTESLLLALLAAGAGLLVAKWLMALLAAFPFKIPLAVELRLDARVLGFTLLAAVATSLIFGLAPAWRAAQLDLISSIKEGGRAGKTVTSNLLVVAQIALSLALLVGAGLLARSLWNLRHIETGFNADRVLLMQFDLEPRVFTASHGLSFYQQLLDRVRALPGVEAASLTKNVSINPLRMKKPPVAAEGAEPQREEDWLNAQPDFISPGYFQTLGVRLLGGRDFDARDAVNAPRTIIVNQTLAERLWPGQTAVGSRLKIADEKEPYTVVAVAPNLKYRALVEAPQPYYYLPLAQHYLREMTLQAHTTTEPLALAAAVRQAAREVDANAFIRETSTLNSQISAALSQPQMTAIFSGVLGLIALALAATGLYSVIAYSVARRTQEIGIRMALGANTRDVLRLVIGQGMKLALAGVMVGALASFALARLLAKLLFGVTAADPPTFAVIALVLLSVALLACWIPARRAAKVDPMVALRVE